VFPEVEKLVFSVRADKCVMEDVSIGFLVLFLHQGCMCLFCHVLFPGGVEVLTIIFLKL
jgi:hypothetical protein